MAARTGNIAFRLSNAVRNTASPPIAQSKKWASMYIPTPGRPVLDMSQGVPGIPPPQVLLDSLGAAGSDPRSCGYCPLTGELAMREALAQEMKVVYGKDTDVTAEDVALTAGSNMAFVASILCVADSGDDVILPVPWYFNHQMSLDMLGIRTVGLQTSASEGFLPSVERCAALITSNTRAIVLVTPNNPTGAIYSHSLIASFARLAKERGIVLIVDETYRDTITNGIPHNLFTPGVKQPSQLLPGDWAWRNHIIHLFSFSKSYCIPGHRLGAIVASHELLDRTEAFLDNLQICAPRPVQLGLYPLLPQLRGFINETAQAIVHRHELFRSLLPAPWRIGSQGAYYAFVQHPFKNISSVDVCRRLASEIGVATVPAPFFAPKVEDGQSNEADKWIRFSVVNVDDDKVRKVCERLKESETQFGWEVEA